MAEDRAPLKRSRPVPPAQERYADTGRADARFERDAGPFEVSCHGAELVGSERGALYPATHRFTMTGFAPVKGEKFTVNGEEYAVVNHHDPRERAAAGDLRGPSASDAGKFVVILARRS
jgi:hypothetical protein